MDDLLEDFRYQIYRPYVSLRDKYLNCPVCHENGWINRQIETNIPPVLRAAFYGRALSLMASTLKVLAVSVIRSIRLTKASDAPYQMQPNAMRARAHARRTGNREQTTVWQLGEITTFEISDCRAFASN